MQIPRANCFPVTHIDKVIRNFLNRQFIPHTKPMDKVEDESPTICSLPCLGNHSFSICNYITKLIKANYRNVRVQFVFKLAKRVSSFFQYKDRVPTLVCLNV